MSTGAGKIYYIYIDSCGTSPGEFKAMKQQYKGKILGLAGYKNLQDEDGRIEGEGK